MAITVSKAMQVRFIGLWCSGNIGVSKTFDRRSIRLRPAVLIVKLIETFAIMSL